MDKNHLKISYRPSVVLWNVKAARSCGALPDMSSSPYVTHFWHNFPATISANQRQPNQQQPFITSNKRQFCQTNQRRKKLTSNRLNDVTGKEDYLKKTLITALSKISPVALVFTSVHINVYYLTLSAHPLKKRNHIFLSALKRAVDEGRTHAVSPFRLLAVFKVN